MAAPGGPYSLAAIAREGPLIRQVYISHTGRDKDAMTFTASVLKPALEVAGLKVFMNFVNLPPDSTWPSQLIDAAANSAVMVPVLSKTYTQSFWSMLELDLALNSRSQQQNATQMPRVVPVFYDDAKTIVQPQKIQQYWEGEKGRLPFKRQAWVDPQRWVANIQCLIERPQAMRMSATVGKDIEFQLARRVVAAAVAAMPRQMFIPSLVVATEEQEAKLVAELVVSDPTRLGLWLHGCGGSGKTTMAKLLFNRLAPHFQHGTFIELTPEEGSSRLEQHLVTALKELGAKGFNEQGSAPVLLNTLCEYVCDKQVLLVLDNVWSARQLDGLLPTAFGPGSKLIITSRVRTFYDSELLQQLQQGTPVLLQHQIELLSEEGARVLFRKYAVLPAAPSSQLRSTEDAIIAACGGLPLALRLAGSWLRGNGEGGVQPLTEWEAVLKALQYGGTLLSIDGSDILRHILFPSFVRLESAQKHMFLDVATVLQGQAKDQAMAVWTAWHGQRANFWFEGLERSNLLSSDAAGLLQMHNMLAALGRGIVRDSSPSNLFVGSRAWVQGGRIVGQQQGAAVLAITTAGYPQQDLTGIAEYNLSQLRILIAPEVADSSSLQKIVSRATALQWLDLSGCRLHRLPELHSLTSLQLLNLSGCAELVLREKRALAGLQLSLRQLQIVTGDFDVAALAALLTVAGHDDRPASKDSLGMGPIAKGAATFLLHPRTAATTMAVYARWGSGKSSFMKLMEAQMLLQAAEQQLKSMARQHYHYKDKDNWQLYKRYNELHSRHGAKGMSADDWLQLQALASPRLLTVWFNSWQYLTEEQVWSGLVVEVTQRLEEKLGHEQRRLMRGWWIISPWDFLWLLLVPMRLMAALSYNWKARRMDLILRCFCPMLLVLAVVGVCMGVGIWELQKQTSKPAETAGVDKSKANSTSKADDKTTPMTKATPVRVLTCQKINIAAVAAIAAAGAIASLLGVFVLSFKNCKQISDTLIEARSHVKFADHSSKIGYQHAVIKDLRLLRKLLCKSLKPFSAKQPGCYTCTAAVQDQLLPVEASAAATSQTDQAKESASGTPPPDQAKQRDDDDEPRIVVFIDDLDRCKPSKIIEVLEAINLVLAGSSFVVVVGMDKDFVSSAIQSAYKDVEIMKSEAKAAEFLDKIVQVELTLPTPATTELQGFLEDQGFQLSAAGVEVMVSAPTSKLTADLPARKGNVSNPQAGSSAAGDRGLAAGDKTDNPQVAAAEPAADAAGAAAASAADAAVVAVDATDASDDTAAAAANDTDDANGPAGQRFNQQYSEGESKMISFLHRAGQLLGTTPRDLKRMLNRYLLAKLIMQAALQGLKHGRGGTKGGFDSTDEVQLLAWVLLWWKYPLAMRELTKPDQAAVPSSRLLDLLEQQHQCTNQEPTTNEDSTAASTSINSTASKLDAADAVAAAKKALAEANTAVALAADDADKKKAETAVKEGFIKIQMSELWAMCSTGSAGNSELQDMLDIDIAAMLQSDHADQAQRIRNAVYRLFNRA